jgi:hypothetical protein
VDAMLDDLADPEFRVRADQGCFPSSTRQRVRLLQ